MVAIDRNSSILPLFWDLASPELEKRIEATQTLIVALKDFQEQFQSKLLPVIWEDHLNTVYGDMDNFSFDKILHGDVAYSLTRLIKGLGSPREAARQGFALALTELIRLVPFLPISQVISLILENNPVSCSTKSEFARNMVFGRLFGLMCLVQSEIILKPQVKVEDWKLLLSSLEDLKATKSFVQESCSHLFSLLIVMAETSPLKSELVTLLWKFSIKSTISYCDELAPILYLLKTFPELQNQVGSFDLLSSKNLSDLAMILRRQRPNQLSNLPLAWKLLLDNYETSSPTFLTTSFSDFWSEVVDNNLFIKSAGPDREFLGLLAIQYILPKLNPEQLSFILTKNLIVVLINCLNQKDSLLFKFGTETLNHITEAISAHPKAGITLLTLFYEHSFNTKSVVLPEATQKSVNGILLGLDEKSILEFIAYLRDVFTGKQQLNGISSESQEKFAVNQMVKLLKVVKAKNSEESFKQVIEFLTFQSFFINVKPSRSYSHLYSSSKPSSETQKLCSDNLTIVLSNSLKMVTLVSGKAQKSHGLMSSGEPWIKLVLDLVDQLEKDSSFELSNPLDDSVTTLIKNARKMLRSIQDHLRSKNSDLSEAAKGFNILLLHIIYQLRIDSNDLGPILEDISKSIAGIFTKKKASSKDDEPAPEPVDVMVEILTSFLSMPSILLHEVSGVVFKNISGLFKESTLSLIFEILMDSGDEKAGLLDVEEDEELSDVDMANLSDVEEVSDGSNDPTDDESDQEASDVESVESESESSTEDVDQEFLTRVKAALGPAVESEAEDSEDLDDDQMMAFDEALGRIFKEQKAVQKQKKNVKDTLSHIKAKLINWIDQFSQLQSKNLLMVNLGSSLLSLANFYSGSITQKTIFDRTVSIMTKSFSQYQPDSVNTTELLELLTIAHTQFNKTTIPEMRRACLSMCNYVISAYKKPQLSISVKDGIVAAYEKSLSAFLDHKNSKKGELVFMELMASSPQLGWNLTSALLSRAELKVSKLASNSSQAILFLSELLNQTIKQKFNPDNQVKAFSSGFFALMKTVVQNILSNEDIAKITKADYLKDLLKSATYLMTLINTHRMDKSKATSLDNSVMDQVNQVVEKQFKNNQGLKSTVKLLTASLETHLTMTSSTPTTPKKSKKKADSSSNTPTKRHKSQ